MKGRSIAVLAIIFMMPAALLAQDRMIVDVTRGHETWTVEGRSEQALIDHITMNDNLYTVYMLDVQASYYFDQNVNDGCWLTGGRLNVHTITSDPQWADRDEARRSLRRRWDRYVEGVHAYAEGHHRISELGAQAIAQRLEAVPAQPTCRQLENELDRLLEALIQSLDDAHRQYERESGGMPSIRRPIRMQ